MLGAVTPSFRTSDAQIVSAADAFDGLVNLINIEKENLYILIRDKKNNLIKFYLKSNSYRLMYKTNLVAVNSKFYKILFFITSGQ
jgi:hypothetical protein